MASWDVRLRDVCSWVVDLLDMDLWDVDSSEVGLWNMGRGIFGCGFERWLECCQDLYLYVVI